MKNPICRHCNSEALYSFAPFPNVNWKSYQDPSFKFHIGIKCVQCGKWSGWVTQTKELMKYLQGAVLIPTDKINDSPRIEGASEAGQMAGETTDVRESS